MNILIYGFICDLRVLRRVYLPLDSTGRVRVGVRDVSNILRSSQLSSHTRVTLVTLCPSLSSLCLSKTTQDHVSHG